MNDEHVGNDPVTEDDPIIETVEEPDEDIEHEYVTPEDDPPATDDVNDEGDAGTPHVEDENNGD